VKTNYFSQLDHITSAQPLLWRSSSLLALHLLSASKGPLLAKVCYNRRQAKRVTHISSPLFMRSYLMSKKLTSTILLFSVFIGFLWWGLAMLTSSLSATVKDGESIIYS